MDASAGFRPSGFGLLSGFGLRVSALQRVPRLALLLLRKQVADPSLHSITGLSGKLKNSRLRRNPAQVRQKRVSVKVTRGRQIDFADDHNVRRLEHRRGILKFYFPPRPPPKNHPHNFTPTL